MKITKRVIASLLATLMVLASLLTVNVFAAEDIVFPDVADDYAYKNAIYSLVDKGIINGFEEDGVFKFKPEETITRAQFAKMLAVYLIGDESLLTETTDRFPDSTTHWANKHIAYAVNAGIINGYEDGTFRPDNPVKYGEAVKMLVCAKGYGKLYEATTPWYKGYIDIAKDMRLTSNALADGESPAYRGLVAQLIYNMDYTKALNVSGGVAGGSGDDGFNFKDDEEEYEEGYGVVVGVFNSSLTGEKLGLNKFQIMIDNTVFKIKDGADIQDYYKYLGKGVEIEYIDGTNQIVRIEEDGNNDTITIAAEDIYNVKGDCIEFYDEDDKEDEAKLSSDLYVIYNGQGVPQRDIDADFIKEYFDIDCGEITLMNNNGGRDYEIAYVTSYETYYVTGRSVNKDTYTFTDSYAGKSVVLKNDDEDFVVYKVDAGGKKAASTVSAIGSSKVVLSVAAPLGSGVTEAIVSTATLKNAEIDGMSGYDEIEIKSKEYSVSDYYLNLLDKDEDTYSLKVGDRATFYLDYSGRIAFMTKAESTEPYGYIMAYDDGSGFDSEKAVMIFDNTGKVQEYPLKSNVKVNGKSAGESGVRTALSDNASVLNKEISENIDIKNAEYSQLVKFTTSTENGRTVVSEIMTIDHEELSDGNIVPHAIFDGKTKLKCSTSSGSTRTFVNASNSVQFIVNSSTTVFLIPDDRLDEEEYKKKDYRNFYSGSFYNIEAYDVDKATKAAKVVLVYAGGTSSAATILENVQARIIADISSVKNPEDPKKPLTQVSYYTVGANESEPKNITTEDADVVKGVGVGDLVRFAIEDNELVGIQEIFVDGVLYDHEEGLPFDTFKAESNKLIYKYGSDADYFTVIYGTVDSTDIEGNILSVVAQIVDNNDDYDSGKNWSAESVGSAKFYDYDEEDDEVLTDITLGSLTPANNGTTVDAVNASKVVIIKRADKVEGVYLVD